MVAGGGNAKRSFAGRISKRSLGSTQTTQRGGALLPFVLKVVARACVGRGSGQPRMPPRERQHEGLGGDWGILSHARSLGTTQTTQRGGALLPFVLRVVAGACVGRRSGQPRMPPQERQHEGFWFLGWGILSRARERPATHAAAGAAARGVRGIGGFFYTSGSGGTGGVIHCRRAAAGATRRGFLRRFVCRGGFSDEFQGAGEIAAPPAVALVEAVDLIGERAQRSGGLGLAG